MNELALFAGAGGGILGGKLLGWDCVCAVEIEEYPRSVLIQRQRDGVLGRFPIWDDICTFDGKPWRGKIDIITGGFPCQDISIAGKGIGIEGSRSGLWGEMARIIREVQPRYALMENSPMLTSRGLGRVLGDLAEMGYNARWCVLGADDVGANHRRKRIWILAYPKHIRGNKTEISSKNNGTQSKEQTRKDICSNELKGDGCIWEKGNLVNSNCQWQPQQEKKWKEIREWIVNASEKSYLPERGQITWWKHDPANMGNSKKSGQQGSINGQREMQSRRTSTSNKQQQEYQSPIESRLGRVAHGVADRVDRLKSIGNGQVPEVVVAAWNILNCNGL